MPEPLTVYFDGACPICRREIAWYQGRRSRGPIEWVDVNACDGERVAPDLSVSAALGRFHVRLPDGRLVHGGRAFAELWIRLPGLRWLGGACRARALAPALEAGYGAFLRVRPWLQRRARGGNDRAPPDYPRWLERALRSDHAGETGAVAIYDGILAVTRDPELRSFARRHRETETRHLAIIETLLPERRRSRLLPVWRAAGFATGAFPALFGGASVYRTIDAVETFVDHHYGAQVALLARQDGWHDVMGQLERCRADEVAHRDEARRALTGSAGLLGRLWERLVALGSVTGVAIASRL